MMYLSILRLIRRLLVVIGLIILSTIMMPIAYKYRSTIRNKLTLNDTEYYSGIADDVDSLRRDTKTPISLWGYKFLWWFLDDSTWTDGMGYDVAKPYIDEHPGVEINKLRKMWLRRNPATNYRNDTLPKKSANWKQVVEKQYGRSVYRFQKSEYDNCWYPYARMCIESMKFTIGYSEGSGGFELMMRKVND